MDLAFHGHIVQPTPRTCTHACLAMVTGRPVDSFIERFGDTGLQLNQYIPVLIEHRLYPIETTGQLESIPYTGVYLISVPSLNIPHGAHMVTLVVDDNGYRVYDPNYGRSGVKALEIDAYDRNLVKALRTFYLDPHMLVNLRSPTPEAVVSPDLDRLKERINSMPTRREPLGGQQVSYVQKAEVLDWIDECNKRPHQDTPVK